MAANLDRAETSLTAVSDIAYIRAIDSSGNSVRISKADLASVLGVGLRSYKHISSSTNIDELGAGVYDGIGWSFGDTSTAGYLLCFVNSNAYRFQIALIYASNGNQIKHRCYNSSYGWSNWV